MEVKHGTFNRWNRWNHSVNLSTGIVIQQEVTESCSKQEVSRIPEVGERELGNENFEETRQLAELIKNYADFRNISDRYIMNQGERKLE